MMIVNLTTNLGVQPWAGHFTVLALGFKLQNRELDISEMVSRYEIFQRITLTRKAQFSD
jgi:hypothetical protein